MTAPLDFMKTMSILNVFHVIASALNAMARQHTVYRVRQITFTSNISVTVHVLMVITHKSYQDRKFVHLALVYAELASIKRIVSAVNLTFYIKDHA